MPIRILHLDDDETDHILVKREITSKQLPAAFTYVRSESAYTEALQREEFDIILSDHRMPNYDGDKALRLALQVCPRIPFVMVTGELGEDRAIETLKRGAWDYVLKDNLKRLVPAIERALAEAEERKKLHEAEERLRESEGRLRLHVENSPLAIIWSTRVMSIPITRVRKSLRSGDTGPRGGSASDATGWFVNSSSTSL